MHRDPASAGSRLFSPPQFARRGHLRKTPPRSESGLAKRGVPCRSSMRRCICGARARRCRRTAPRPIWPTRRCATWMPPASTGPSCIRRAGTPTPTSCRSRRRAPIPTASPSSAASRSTGPRAGRWSRAGRSGRACSACASRSCSRTEELADRRHHGLAVAGGGEGRPAGRAAGGRLPAAGRADRRAASAGSS